MHRESLSSRMYSFFFSLYPLQSCRMMTLKTMNKKKTKKRKMKKMRKKMR